jgi:hypothetical protein
MYRGVGVHRGLNLINTNNSQNDASYSNNMNSNNSNNTADNDNNNSVLGLGLGITHTGLGLGLGTTHTGQGLGLDTRQIGLQNQHMDDIETIVNNLREAFPSISRERIRADLIMTRSTEFTVERIFNGSLGWYGTYGSKTEIFVWRILNSSPRAIAFVCLYTCVSIMYIGKGRGKMYFCLYDWNNCREVY